LSWLERVTSIGLTDDLSDHSTQQIRLLNVLVMVAFAASMVSLAVGFIEEIWRGLPVNIAFALLLGVILWLQHRRKHFVAAMAINLLAIVATSAQLLVVGIDSGIHHWFVPMMLLPLVSVPPGREKIAVAVASTMVLVYGSITASMWYDGAQTYASFLAQLMASVAVLLMGIILRRSTYLANRQTISQSYQIVVQSNAVTSLNRQLKDSLAHVRDVSRLKEEFVASMSHELRSPLNAVMGLSEALQENVYGPLTEDQRRSLVTIEESGRKLLGLFDDLLDFARIGAGRLPTQIGPVGIVGTVQAEVRRSTSRASQKDIGVTFETRATAGVIQSDARHVRRILSNLLSNAVKFTPEGGQIGVDICDGQSPDVVQISVWDTGPGIDPSQLSRLFEPFVQLDGGLARRYGGTGLGLALTSRLTQLIGGLIDVQSEVGIGSRFTLSLPVEGPLRGRVYADLSCPFCFTLNEWLEEANQHHLIEWRGIEHLPDLTPEVGRCESERTAIQDELAQLQPHGGGVVANDPGFRPNTRLGLAVLRWIADQQPTCLSEARRALFRAIWWDGIDISELAAIRGVLQSVNLRDLGDLSVEIAAVQSETRAWRERSEKRLPTVVGIQTDRIYVGLGERGALLEFLDQQSAPLPEPLSPFDSEMATQNLEREMVRLTDELEQLRPG
jgi:signal transduction histidine kinase